MARELSEMADRAFDQAKPYLDRAVKSVDPILKEAQSKMGPVWKGAQAMADPVIKGAKDMADPVLREAKEQNVRRNAKQEIYVQYGDHELRTEDIAARCRENYEQNGGDLADLKELQIYVKPEDNAAYYVVNGSTTGKIVF
ncbi:MAG: hypothetical protein IJT34_07875 [Butyrivibrio sp.]|nr:hypothetical protein [Butyrivibrio sp.]